MNANLQQELNLLLQSGTRPDDPRVQALQEMLAQQGYSESDPRYNAGADAYGALRSGQHSGHVGPVRDWYWDKVRAQGPSDVMSDVPGGPSMAQARLEYGSRGPAAQGAIDTSVAGIMDEDDNMPP